MDMLIVMIVGIALLVFGAVILIKFPNRPGGKIAWAGTEVSSVGAGLPLIVLGVACIIYSAKSGSLRPVFFGKEVETLIRGGQNCLEHYLQDMPKDRVATLEEGVGSTDLIGPQQSSDGMIAIKFTENAAPVGAIKFRFFSNGEIFKVESIVDESCQAIEEYSNSSRGGDKRVLQNWDTLKMNLGGDLYFLRLGYDAGIIGVNYFKKASLEPDP